MISFNQNECACLGQKLEIYRDFRNQIELKYITYLGMPFLVIWRYYNLLHEFVI